MRFWKALAEKCNSFALFLKAATQLDLFDMPVDVEGYTRSDGTFVPRHQSHRKKKPKLVAAKRKPAKVEPEPKPKKASEAPRPGDNIAEIRRKMEAREAKVEAKIKKLIDDSDGGLGLELKHKDTDGWVLILPDASEPGKFRYEQFDAHGVSGHAVFNSALEAVRSVVNSGYTIHDKGAMDRLSTTPEWNEGMRVAWQNQSGRPDYSLQFGQVAPVSASDPFGVRQGVTKTERRNANLRAIDLVRDGKPEDLGERSYRGALSEYTGRGGIGDSLNEFYTPQLVAMAGWKILDTLGIDKGNVLEPCCGTGVFLHTAPAGVRITGVEMDPTSAEIAGILHGKRHEVAQSSMESFATSDVRQFDAVIGNVPFGLRGSLIKDDKPGLKTAEQYFVDMAIDKTREGGIVALVVPTGIMDGKNTRGFRERILRKAEFLGAHRMPNTAFAAAHTEVTTDLIVLRARPKDVAQALGTVNRDTLKKIGVWDAEFLSGGYFEARGAKNIHGTVEAGWREKAGMGHDLTVTGDMRDVPEGLASFQPDPVGFNPVMDDVLGALDEAGRQRAINAALKPAYEHAVLGDTKTVDGVLYVLQGHPPRWHRADADNETHESVSDAGDVSGTLDRLFQAEALHLSDMERTTLRQRAVEQLDAYVGRHGPPAKNKELRRAVKDNKTLFRLFGAVNDDGSYSELVTGRKSAVLHDDFDTVARRLAVDAGAFTVVDIAEHWTGGDEDAALDRLFASRDYMVESDGATWTTRDEYQSGDMYSKLDAAREALAREDLAPEYKARYEEQANALEDIIDPKGLEDVEIMLNSGWIPLDVIAEYFNARLDKLKEQHPESSYYRELAAFEIDYEKGLFTVTGGHGANDLLSKYLNRAGVRKDDLPKINSWNKDFKDWLLGSDRRDELEEMYNRKFRGFRAKTYSDAPMEIPGLNPAIGDINAYHFSALRWALEAGKGIIAADVGLGKTVEGLMLAKLAKAQGTARKPTIVVPKSVLANWMAEIDFWFPGSSVLVIGETYTKDKNGNLKSKTDNKAARDKKYHELSQNEYDFVLISQPAFNDLDVDPITKGEYLNSDFWVQRGDAMGNAGDKRTNKIREAYNQAMAEREGLKARTDAIYFNDLGIDMLIVDEAHMAKNLFGIRSRFGQQPKFLGGGGLSNRALDMQFKSRLVREANDGKNVYFLTATPTRNSPLEIFSMLSHIAPEAFDAIGIKNSEEFIDRFVEFQNENIVQTNGKIDEALVTAGFKNLDELREIMTRYIDRKTADDVGLVIPKPVERQHVIEMSATQKAVYSELREMAEDAGGKDAIGDAHIFSIMDKMGKAAMDLELLGDEHAGEVSPKYVAAAKEIVAGAKEGGQVVFVDHNDSHEKMKSALVAAGIPSEQIGIINAKAASSSAKRQNISDAFNTGKFKVVIGNTATMGEGVNLQKGTTDIHHLNLPWDPASMQQRNGRGLRQGNVNDSVRIHSYLARGSFDAYRYQTLMAKKSWQDELWNGGDRVDNSSREGNFSRDDLIIMLADDPDAARAELQGNKAAALERDAARKRGEAVGEFVRFQEMKRNLGKLKDKGTRTAARLESRIDTAREKLKANKHFAAKQALDMDHPVVIQSDTGTAWHAGTSFELDAGKEGPIHWSDDKTSQWVVTKVSPGIVSAKPYGEIGAKPRGFDLDKMNRGVRPVAYSEADEIVEIERRAEESAESQATTVTNPTALRGMNEATLRRLAPIIQKQLRDAYREYKDGWRHDHVPMLDEHDRPVAVRGYDARKKLDTHQIMLPLPEHEKLAIEGWMQSEAQKRFQARYNMTGRGRNTYRSSQPSGVEMRYEHGILGHGNPWKSAGEALFGKDFETKAREDFIEVSVSAAEVSRDFNEAVGFLLPTATATLGRLSWPEKSLRAMLDSAKRHGVLGQQWGGTIKEGSPDLRRIGVTQVQSVLRAIREMARISGEHAVANEIDAQQEKRAA